MNPTPSAMETNRAAVYLLQRRDRRRFKLGWARRPIVRVRQFPEYRRRELDLEASSAIWLPDRVRAEQIERSMHKTLAPFSVAAGHHGDGRSEWFEGVVHDTALRLLSQMPLGERASQPARVVKLTLPPPPADAVSIETSPLDTWWVIEDLLSRLAMHCPITIREGDVPEVVVHGLRTASLGALRQAALDPDSYQCWRSGRPLAFVRTLAFDGDDLVLQFMSCKVIERWDDDTDLVWQVKGFLARLKRKASLAMAA